MIWALLLALPTQDAAVLKDPTYDLLRAIAIEVQWRGMHCFGDCPDYTIIAERSGRVTVIYRMLGRYRSTRDFRISKARFAELERALAAVRPVGASIVPCREATEIEEMWREPDRYDLQWETGDNPSRLSGCTWSPALADAVEKSRKILGLDINGERL